MQGKITGIDITGNQLTAVQVKTGLRGYQVLAWARVPVPVGRNVQIQPPWPCCAKQRTR